MSESRKSGSCFRSAAWRVNCKPLAGRYYAGVTMAWLLPHVYGFLWPPSINVYTEANYDIMHYIYSKSAAVMVPVIGVMLALLASLCAATLEL